MKVWRDDEFQGDARSLCARTGHSATEPVTKPAGHYLIRILGSLSDARVRNEATLEATGSGRSPSSAVVVV